MKKKNRERKEGREGKGGRKERREERERRNSHFTYPIHAPSARFYCYLFISSPFELDPFFSFSPTEIVLLE